MLTFRFTGADGRMVEEETLTSGMIGKKVKLEFSDDWNDLRKTAVFMAGSVTRDVLQVSDVIEIPAEVLAVPLKRLYVGVYGVSGDRCVIPTIRAPGPIIEPGTDPSGDEGTNPALPFWAQIEADVDALEKEVDALKNSSSGGGLTVTDEGEGNVTITAGGSAQITDDGSGNVVIS